MTHISVNAHGTSDTVVEDGLSRLDPEYSDRRELDYDATVPRGLVHRKAVAEVFVTDSRQVEENVYDVAAQLPRGHVMLEDRTYDVPIVVEACRQAGVLISHRHLDVPQDQAFVMRHIGLDIAEPAALRQGDEPARMLIRVDVDLRTSRSGRIQGYDFVGRISINGRDLGTAHGSLFFMSKKAYRVVRANGRAALDIEGTAQPQPSPCDPAAVGRRDHRNVVISEPVQRPENGWSATVVADHGHPHLFDHPLDHLPGNLLVEASRQLAVVSAARSGGLAPSTLFPISIAAEFTTFCENDLTTVVEAEPAPFRKDDKLGPVAAVDVRVLQKGDSCATMRIEVAQW